MDAELIRQALEIVDNPNIQVNLVSRRVRQLNAGAGAISRSLIADTGQLGVADIALREIAEGKIGWEMPEVLELTRPMRKKLKKHQAESKALRGRTINRGCRTVGGQARRFGNHARQQGMK